MMIHGLANFKP